ncbi:hypothetical protein [Mucilaginibacter sp. HD30]
MYFLTLKDPNYMVKGSRDPLGFQVLWQQAGRTVIPALSTVSNNIRDFQVIALARFCQKAFKVPDRDELAFFLCFEQLMAYVRFVESSGYDSFNGIDKVNRIMAANDKHLSLSIGSDDQLLSNQKSYGIWGKYNRPFEEIGLGNDTELNNVQQQKLDENKKLFQVVEELAAKKGAQLNIDKDMLAELTSVFARPQNKERRSYIDHLLEDMYGGVLLNLAVEIPEITEKTFYEQLDILEAKTSDNGFALQIQKLRSTERVLSPLNRVFRYLQGQSYWSFKELENDELIHEWTKRAPITGPTLIHERFSAILNSGNRELVTGLSAVNSEVCARRGSEPWLTITTDGVEVNHFEGGFTQPGYNPLTENDYTYFLNTWFHLFKQLN